MKPLPLHVIADKLRNNSVSHARIENVAIDSRLVTPGSLFFALPGKKVDGHSFLEEAKNRGASGFVLHTSFQGNTFDLPVIYVEDVLKALQQLAQSSLKDRNSKVIALTGSIGKTTTKYFSQKLLSTHFKVASSPLSYNSKITLPLSILNVDGDEDYLILEMGMTHPGDIAHLVSISPPTISLLTQVSLQHSSNFSEGLSSICQEKSQVFSQRSTDLGIYPYEIVDREKVQNTGTCRKVTFSTQDERADFFLRRLSSNQVDVITQNSSNTFTLTTPHKGHDHNFLAAVSLARMLDIPWEKLQKEAPHLTLPPMRFEKVEKEGICFINDAYNASPETMKVALENIPSPEKEGRKVAILGEMDDLGIFSEREHNALAEVALNNVELLLCVGVRCESMQKMWHEKGRPAYFFPDRLALEKQIKKHLKPGDVVLIKGCRSLALDLLLKHY